MPDNNYYPILVIGSTFAGLGAACADRENTLVVDRTSIVGYEFINSFNSGQDWNDVKLSEEGEKLKRELLNRNILTADGAVYIPAVAPVLYARIKREKLKVLLLTEVMDIRRSGDTFEVVIYNTFGFQKLVTHKIIDTRCDCIPSCRISSKYLNAVIHTSDENIGAPYFMEDAIQVIKGRYPGDAIVKLKLDIEDSWITARHKLHQFWENRPEALKPWAIAAVADAFDIKTVKEVSVVEEGWFSVPSAGCRNPLEAFEAGTASVKGGVLV